MAPLIGVWAIRHVWGDEKRIETIAAGLDVLREAGELPALPGEMNTTTRMSTRQAEPRAKLRVICLAENELLCMLNEGGQPALVAIAHDGRVTA